MLVFQTNIPRTSSFVSILWSRSRSPLQKLGNICSTGLISHQILILIHIGVQNQHTSDTFVFPGPWVTVKVTVKVKGTIKVNVNVTDKLRSRSRSRPLSVTLPVMTGMRAGAFMSLRNCVVYLFYFCYYSRSLDCDIIVKST